MTHAKSILDLMRQMPQADYALPLGIPPGDFAREVASYLRSSDPELRDTLAYGILVHILEERLLTETDVKELLELVIGPDYLYRQIGESQGDGVFGRSFSALIIGAIVEIDAEKPLLSLSVIQQSFNALLDYITKERDFRGLVKGKGWAHAAAHTADALAAFAIHPTLGREKYPKILSAISHLAKVPHPLNYLEDDRLAFAALTVIQRANWVDLDWSSWLKTFNVKTGGSQHDALRHANAGHFLRALYFLLRFEEPEHYSLNSLYDAIKGIHPHYQSS